MKDFQTFSNEAVKLLSKIQSRAEEHGHQVQQPQPQTLSRSSSTTSTFVPQTFQQLSAPAVREYILRTAATNQRAADFLHSCRRPTGWTFKSTHLYIASTKHFNPPSVASATGEESQHDIRTFKFLRKPSIWMSYQQIDTLQPFSPVDMPAPTASPPTTTATQQEHQQPPAQLQPPPHLANENSSSSRIPAKPPISLFRATAV